MGSAADARRVVGAARQARVASSSEPGLRLDGWIGARGSRTPGARHPAFLTGDAGATTAEFAIVTMAAVGFAGLLVVILRSDGVRATLEALVARALGSAG